MDTKQKYIKTRKNEIIIFPIFLQHNEFKNFQPVSAGFCDVFNDYVKCYGESVSLNLKSDIKDSGIATRQIFGDY